MLEESNMAGSVKLYMQSPLVLWVETFKANDGHPLEYQDLYDGVFLNDVMQQIDPRPNYDNVNRSVDDVSVRLVNWDVLVKNIRGYYMDVLQQLLVTRLPNISAICKDPAKDSSFAEIRKTVLLILGCAVQCEHKETYIDKIMAMDIRAQTEIVDNIKEITDDSESILSVQRPDSPGGCKSYMDKMFNHLHRLVRERDDCAEIASDLGQERDFYMSQAEGKVVVDTPQMSPQKHHIALELAECKAKLRHFRQEGEDYHEQLSDVKEELKKSSMSCSQLKNENANLLQEARATRSLRDELDIMKEKAAKVDMFEKEILKYKERLNELEFYKARTEELKEDNGILEETKAMLEDQLTNSRKRIETVVELESELGRYRLQAEQMTRDRDDDREKIEYLTGENARLEFEKKSSMNESANLESELMSARNRIGSIGGSLSDQLTETSHSRFLRLELENQRLASKLAEMKETALIQNAEISLELEKENQRLVKRMEKFQTSACESSEQVVQMESDLSNVKEEKERLVKALDAIKENSDRQVRELERENEQLSQTLDSIRERIEKTSDAKVRDLERENKRLHETVTAKNSALSKHEFETRQLQRSVQQLQENVERIQSLEQDCQQLEKENSDFHQKVATLQHTSERLEATEQENSDLCVENRKLKKTVDSLQLAAQRREHLEQDQISFKVEHQRLQKTLESLRVESERTIELETENDDLKKEMNQLQKSLEGQKTQKLKQEQMEFEILDLSNENQRLQKNLEVTNRRLQQLEKDNTDIETEGEKLTMEVESLRLTSKRLEEKQKETVQLDSELQRAQIDKMSLEKENRKLKQSAELKDTSLDELNTKFSSLDQESKSLRQCVEKMKVTCSKVKDMEMENRELLQDLNTDRRTLATLREELVSEKIKSQELSNQLDQLTGELERVGIDTEKLKMTEQINEENRYKALESMIEETLKKSNELKEEKIQALEMRLEESKKRSTRLQEDLREAKRESEVMKVRLEDEQEEMKTTNQQVQHRQEMRRERPIFTANAGPESKEILELKDRRIELERMNATLLAENKNLKGSNSQLSKQCQDIEIQLANCQSQNSSLQNNSSTLHERIANLQVENSTLKSQCSSTLSQQGMLKEHISRMEMENESLLHNHDKLKGTHSSLMSDHECLQRLHEQLTSDYEKLVKEYNSQKSLHKSLKMEMISLKEQLSVLLQGKDDVNKLQDALEKDRHQLKRELQSLGNLKSDYTRLSEDHQQMTVAYDKLSKDYGDILSSHKQVKTDMNNLQRKSTEQHGEITEAKENLSVADVEFQKLDNKMEAIYQVNERLENENQALLLQIQQLLNQNQELLTQALNSKDHFAEEEKAYLEKLSDLRRQKERLEEKIMEHYKNRISPKKKGLGALIARKARGIISRAPRRSKSRNNLNELNDNSSQGSGSNEHVGDSASRKLEKNSVRRKSSGGVEETEDSPKLASQNHSLAKSYTALHSPVFEDETSPLRGAKSSEDLNEASATDVSLLPGVGRPYNVTESDNPMGPRSTTPGIAVRKNLGRSSPGSEMLTLDQFLKEANKSPRNPSNDNGNMTNEPPPERVPHPHHHHNADNDSRSSDNSIGSNNRSHHLPPPHGSDRGAHRSSLYRPNIPDVTAPSLMSPTASRDISASRISHDNSSFDSIGAVAGDVFTSTPKTEHDSSVVHSSFDPGASPASRFSAEDKGLPGGEGGVNSRYLSQKRLSGEDWRSSSQESSPYASSNRMNSFSNHPPSSSSPRNPSSLTSSSSSLNHNQNPPILSSSTSQSFYHHNHPSNQSALNSNNSSSSRDRDFPPPPIPSEPPPSLPATERLDRLTHQYSSSGDQGMTYYAQPTNVSSRIDGDRSGGHWSAPNHRNSGNSRDNESSSYTELERRKSHGAADGNKGLPNQFQPPIPRSHPGAPSDKRNNMLSNSQSFDSSVVSGHNPRRPTANANLFQNNPHQRPRPSSVMGHSAQVRGVYSRPPGEGRPQAQHHGPIRKDTGDQNQNARPGVERPKSVPPQLFNPVENNKSVDSNNAAVRRDMPIPPPRRTRVDGRDGHSGREAPEGKDPRDVPSQIPPTASSGVSLIREPSRRGSRPSGPPYDLQPRSLSSAQDHHPPNHTSQNANFSQNNIIIPPPNSSRQSGSSMLPSHPFQEQHSSSARNPNGPSSTRPDTIGQHSLNRPDSLPLGGHGSHQTHGYSSTLPSRSHSSMGNPVSSFQSHQQLQMQSRSSTPGPQYNRRDPSSGQRNSDVGLASSSFRGREPVAESGDYQGQYSDSRQRRASSDPREVGYGSESENPTAVHPHQRTSQNPSSSNPRPLSRGPSHVPPQSRQPPGLYGDHRSSNGPLSPHAGGPQGSHFNNSSSSQHSQSSGGSLGPPLVQPQIRSQGKSPTTNHAPSTPGSQMRSARDAFSPQDRGTPGLTSALPNAATIPNQQKPPPSNVPRPEGEGEGDGQPPKNANSIWRPRWS